MRAFFAFHHHNVVPRRGACVPSVVFCFLPCVEVARKVVAVSISDVAVTRAHLGKHEEWAVVSFSLVLLCSSGELREEVFVERQARDVTTGVNTETVAAHFDEFRVALYEVVSHGLVFGV